MFHEQCKRHWSKKKKKKKKKKNENTNTAMKHVSKHVLNSLIYCDMANDGKVGNYSK